VASKDASGKKQATIHAARWKLEEHPLFDILSDLLYLQIDKNMSNSSWAQIRGAADAPKLYVNYNNNLSVDEWVYLLALAYLHVGMNHITPTEYEGEPNDNYASAIHAAHSFAKQMGVGKRPEEMSLFMGIAGKEHPPWILSASEHLLAYELHERREQAFNNGLAMAAQTVLAEISYQSQKRSPISQNLREANVWVINSFPLLSALASAFTLIESDAICKRLQIEIAAINPVLKEVYIHPRWRFSKKELIFILLHEYLHVGLRHDIREQGRDPYYWNVACDYVINGWLIEMQVGKMPNIGMLYDSRLSGRSAEDIYDEIMQNQNWQRRLKREQTPRGHLKPDIITEQPISWWISGDGVSLDEFYRYSIYEGLEYAEKRGRGFIPAGLIEEIRAISQPPIPWDVQLTEWFDQFFPVIEKKRSYARMSRRQSATPDIPRPSWLQNTEDSKDRTFGVLLDTSGSMSRNDLAKAIGAISSYAQSREVRFVRLVYCDAMPYDAGYIDIDILAHRVEVTGRGGTMLQPAVDLLTQAHDFPKRGPVLIITDGYIDTLHVRMDLHHAYLIPLGCRLAFKTNAPVFYFD